MIAYRYTTCLYTMYIQYNINYITCEHTSTCYITYLITLPNCVVVYYHH